VRGVGVRRTAATGGFATWDDFDRALSSEHQGSAFACVDPSGVGPRLFFQRVPEGKVVKNRLHLDVRVGIGLVGEERLAALEAECARLVALGAVRVRLLPADGDNESCLVMKDIEGNEFLSRLSGRERGTFASRLVQGRHHEGRRPAARQRS
jgi:hypothetical protein